MSDQDPTRCCKVVYDRSMRFPRGSQCARKAVVERNGFKWCKQHDPEAEAERREKTYGKFREEREQRVRQHVCAAAMQGIPDPQAFVEAVRGLLDITSKGPIGEPLDHGKAIALAIEQIREHLKESPRG